MTHHYNSTPPGPKTTLSTKKGTRKYPFLVTCTPVHSCASPLDVVRLHRSRERSQHCQYFRREMPQPNAGDVLHRDELQRGSVQQIGQITISTIYQYTRSYIWHYDILRRFCIDRAQIQHRKHVLDRADCTTPTPQPELDHTDLPSNVYIIKRGSVVSPTYGAFNDNMREQGAQAHEGHVGPGNGG